VVVRPGDPGSATGAFAIVGRAAAATCGVLLVTLAAFVLWRSAALLALGYVSVVMAVVLDRPVAALVARGLGRTWALALVLSVVVAVTLAVAAVAVGPLVAQARELATAAPAFAERVRGALAGSLGGVAGGPRLEPWLHEVLSRGASASARGAYEAAGGVASGAGAFATAFLLSVLLLASGPDLVRRAIEALPPARRSWAESLAHDLSVSLGGYLVGLGAIVVARVLATAAFLAIARVPFVVSLSLLAGASVLIPYLGSALRLVVIGAAAWATRGSGGAVAAVAFIVVDDLVENYAVSPMVYRKTVGISALGQLLAVLILGYHLGVIGAVLAIPLAATAQIVVRAARPRTPAAGAPEGPPDVRQRDAALAPRAAAREAPAGGRSDG
jgi:predicted PurR-regulated permease PerM